MGLDTLLGALAATRDFDSAAQAVLSFLRTHLDVEMVAVSRRVENANVVMRVDDSCYGLKPGDAVDWDDEFCARADVDGFISVPVTTDNGLALGSICAASSRPRDVTLTVQRPLLDLIGALLGRLLAHSLRAVDAEQRAEQAEFNAEFDALTGAGNRRLWDRAILAEESRCARNNTSAVIVLIDLDGLKAVNDRLGHSAGDQLICLAADILNRTVRPTDTVARLGGDEFGILASGCDVEGAKLLCKRLRAQLHDAGVEASIGFGHRAPEGTMHAAWVEADEAMYADKRHRRRFIVVR